MPWPEVLVDLAALVIAKIIRWPSLSFGGGASTDLDDLVSGDLDTVASSWLACG